MYDIGRMRSSVIDTCMICWKVFLQIIDLTNGWIIFVGIYNIGVKCFSTNIIDKYSH